ncbi:hypothetical protein VZ94_09725 [Methylocucumis oryzae]|uniref:SpoVT-AbrB domain-containing protein n=1 Tax=Methylocucumis oryzae TaxID=1632867 RepID=A0A0F3IJH8_9GAMM|nr:hypothetical protein VZ94_09725 [Methylocucumis oryzae]
MSYSNSDYITGMSYVTTCKTSNKVQVTIPIDMRKKLRFATGETINWGNYSDPVSPFLRLHALKLLFFYHRSLIWQLELRRVLCE